MKTHGTQYPVRKYFQYDFHIHMILQELCGYLGTPG
jgi:hypothetical protein